MDSNKKTSAKNTVKKIDKNIYFLKHLIECLQGKKSQEVIDKTIEQMENMIKKVKDKIKKNEGNGKL